MRLPIEFNVGRRCHSILSLGSACREYASKILSMMFFIQPHPVYKQCLYSTAHFPQLELFPLLYEHKRHNMEFSTLPISDLEKGFIDHSSSRSNSGVCTQASTLPSQQALPLRKFLQWRPWTTTINQKRNSKVRICKSAWQRTHK